jgi:DNA (cytosine-5)-methyltransferase 1
MEEKALAEAPIWSDLRTFDGKPWRGVVDLITGGYPCQPFSSAGKRLGEDDPRHLWPEIRRIIEEIKPCFVFFENVSGHLTLGLSDVLGDLARMGFRCSAGLFTAEEVGAPHRRERVFVLGVADGNGFSSRSKSVDRQTTRNEKESNAYGFRRELADPACQLRKRKMDSEGRERLRTSGNDCGNVADTICKRGRGGDQRFDAADVDAPGGAVFPPGPADIEQWRRILEADPGLAPAIESQATQPGVRGMAHGAASRVDRLRALGNGVVPLVAAYAFTTLLSCIEE